MNWIAIAAPCNHRYLSGADFQPDPSQVRMPESRGKTAHPVNPDSLPCEAPPRSAASARDGCAEAPLGGRCFRAISPPEKRAGRRRRRRSRRGKVVQGQSCSAPAGPEKSPFSAGLVFSAAWPMRAEGRLLGSEPAGATQLAPDSGLPPRKRGPKAGPEAAAGREASAQLREPRLCCPVASGRRTGSALRVPGAPFIPPGWS